MTSALVAHLESLGGQIVAGWDVQHISELPKARAYLFDTAPSAMARIAGDRLPGGYVRRLAKFKHGAGVYKIDWALNEPIPWTNEIARKAGTVHVGGTFEEISASERASCARFAGQGKHSDQPFVLVAQPTLSDPSRAPKGKHVAWGYCHVPSGSEVDMTKAIESQIERFAPGFRDVVAARAVMTCSDFQAYNPNLIGGDVTGGMNHWSQLFTRPVARLNPYTTPESDIYICSASTPPGGGVHGMCGFWAAEAALGRLV